MSTLAATQKLTKKQKKSLAFRDRKSGKKSTSNGANDDGLEMEDNAIPLMEDQDLASLESGAMEVEGAEGTRGGGKDAGGATKGKGKGKAKAAAPSASEVQSADGVSVGGSSGKTGKSKKRKREDEEAEGEEGVEAVGAKKKKKKKKEQAKEGKDGQAEGEEGDEGAEKKKAKTDKNQRFILFVGNLAYTTKKEAILSHFAASCKPPPTVRLLTPKPRPGVAVRPKSKGCAFLEFQTKAPLQEALKLHQSMLEGRMINVELTAGGGGKSEQRLSKIQGRNKELFGQRQKKVEKSEKGSKGPILSKPDRPQRFSSTSGVDQAPVTKRTWSVGDVVPETTPRGGKGKRAARGNRKSKSEGTGVNAIPVG